MIQKCLKMAKSTLKMVIKLNVELLLMIILKIGYQQHSLLLVTKRGVSKLKYKLAIQVTHNLIVFKNEIAKKHEIYFYKY